MLVDYKNDYKKITMGLLSFVPDLKEVARLQSEMDWYQREENRKLYLWRNEETSDIIGVIGIEIDSEMILLRHIAINPSFRKEGISYQILTDLDAVYSGKKIIGTLETASLITKWEHEKQLNQHSSETAEKKKKEE